MPWKPLDVSSPAGVHLPPLLISANFRADSYTIHLTDLTHIWSESLERHAIIRRSQEEATSINPSEGDDQLQIFLEKIKLGFEGEKNTTLALTINSDVGQPSLILNVSASLPGGLSPLEWPIRLAAASSSFLTSQLIVPSLRAQHARVHEIESLADVLKGKDHVIQKLVDKLEEQGTELGQVFPQAASKAGRKLDRQRAEERVKGLAPFDLEVWRKGIDHEESRDVAQLMAKVFAGNDVEASSIGETFANSAVPDNWWDNIKGITVNLDTGKISTKGLPKSNLKSRPEPKKEESVEEDEFQVQATPPHLSKCKVASSIVDDSTDDDDEDAGATSQASKVPDSFPLPQSNEASPKQKSKQRELRGSEIRNQPPAIADDDTSTDSEPASSRKSTPVKKVPSPIPDTSTVKPKKKLGQLGRKPPPPPPEPEPEREKENPTSRAFTRASPAPKTTTTKKGRLGLVGGKKKQVDQTEPTITEPVFVPSEAAATAKRKLGMVGHSSRATSTEKEEGNISKTKEDERGRPIIKPERKATPPPRETSAERADKKREQLKKELEQKSKGPAKKKRKF